MPKPIAALALAAVVLGGLAAPAAAAELETVFFGNDQEKVEQAAQATLRRTPTDPEANAWLVETAMKQGKWDVSQKALGLAGTSTLAGLLAHADYAWYTGDFQAAQAAYEAAVKLAPRDLHARWGVSSAMLHQGQYEPALKIATELEAEQARYDADFHAWVLVNIGACKGFMAQKGNMLQQIKQGGEAKADFERAMALSPKNPDALSSLGRFYLLAPSILGDKGKAVDLLERAGTMDPFFYLNDAYLIRAYQADGQANKAKVEAAFYRAKFQGLAAPAAELAKIKF